MENLIKCLQILMKYKNDTYPTYCNQETMFVNIDPEIVSKEDIDILDTLGFEGGEDEGGTPCFKSFTYGSC